ncbi:[citrate (pro-3S)-lyase] ligase [Pectobacteriaceae bacterium CE70]|uniref:[Citrate [pro-3S]-lyase] ligase n=1 Tax=Serratia sp. (strain ATCC 39006) TaxID=104623 RepID=A0A2I5TLK8_SERS3|nr:MULTISPECIES: [citrate (pro-3S)-lyase] ligase [Enterobacterales]WJV59927.1 [citrate (pro-3S)-lyase] ligase [Pectobacteriaceae bacterium C111]WJV64265.1 [citrate (pro-3S)-lyase] ligase [Pectobacteriaceae bacterium C52]WJV65304.1 [citrate (pro-3S)-lyase] ligase [Pectobacteriaceae bacterium CE70]WJY09320.1 [citrate (pro-3S)-lyase] ligase [Pectobacteriaceae bacterium C80]AUH01123.1 [citrate (pro-3S)-lyase] ligase [Serratia sp. ATCC 39006]
MYADEALVFTTLEVGVHTQDVVVVRQFLAHCQLGMDNDIETFVVGRHDGQLVACAGLAANTIKCVAVDPAFRDLNLGVQVVNEVVQQAALRGRFHLFLYTKPDNINIFRGCGFYPLAQYDNAAVLMENTPIGIKQYCQTLTKQRQPGDNIGAIVMNANPFTLGHCYLAEQAAAACDWLHIFVVREDVSFFPFTERLDMVRQGVAHIRNLTVHIGSEYMISKATFPGYFLKEEKLITQAHSALDLIIFRQYIAPALGINQRFVGTEPFCPVTHQYNQDMHYWLEQSQLVNAPALKVIEIERKCEAGRAISASEVRKLLKLRQFDSIQDIVPATTFQYLQLQRYGEPACA